MGVICSMLSKVRSAHEVFIGKRRNSLSLSLEGTVLHLICEKQMARFV